MRFPVLTALILATTALTFPAYAEETDSTPPQVNKAQELEEPSNLPVSEEAPDPVQASLDETFKKLESFGLYAKAGDGGLGKDLWFNKRSTLTSLIASMPAASPEPSVQKLIFGILLTEANADNIQNDIDLEPGRDLLTLRLEKLLEGGAYKQAFELYSKLEEEPYDARLGRAGILSMLYSGQKSLACLEANTARDKFPDNAFWKDIIAYCNVALSETPSADDIAALEQSSGSILPALATQSTYKFQYNADAFSKLEQIEQALLVTENRITIPDLDIESIPAAHLQIFLNHPDLSEAQRFAVTARAVSWGLATDADLKDIYKQAIAPASGQDESTTTATSGSKDENLAKLAHLYSIATDKSSDADQWETLRSALALEKNLGTAALRPFAALLHGIEPKDASLAEVASAFRVLNESSASIPKRWASQMDRFSAQDTDINTYSLLLAATYMSDSAGMNSKEDRAKLESAVSRAKPEIQILVNNIIENVDKKSGSVNNAVNVYEKEIDLTFSRDYVMPSVRVWDRAINASQDKAISETILLNTVLLRSQALQNIYPGLLRDVLQGFENVGLTDISEDMAIAALLGNIE